jgi:hypothetical protein
LVGWLHRRFGWSVGWLHRRVWLVGCTAGLVGWLVAFRLA